MRRRRFIGVGATGMAFLAGCSSQSGEDSEPSPTDDSAQTPSRTSTATQTAAQFELRNLQYPETLTVGDSPEIRVKVENVGESGATDEITLFWPGSALSKTVELQPETRETVTFEPGTVVSDTKLAFTVAAQSGSSVQGEIQVTGREVHYVGPSGADENPGTEENPLGTIQHALTRATPGDTIQVRPGVYRERIEPPHGGEPGDPITITGPPDAVLESHPDRYNVVLIRHSHVHITGLTIDGLENPEAPGDVASYSEAQLVQARPPTTTDEYLTDIVVAPHRIGNTQKSLVSLERTRNAEVGPFRVIGPAGTKYLLTDRAGHNGEIVYLGTSPSNLETDWHPWSEYDQTSDVVVHHIDNSGGYGHSELVNTKLGTHDVVVEYCTDGGGSKNTEDGPAASIRFQSFDATVRWCDLQNGAGNGVEIASFKARDAQAEAENPSAIQRRGGTDNAVYGNRIVGFDDKAVAYPVASQTEADQRHVCGNEYDGQTDGTPAKACPAELPDGDGVGHTGGRSPWA